MKAFEVYFNDNEIIRHICKIRIKFARSKSKQHLLHLLTSSPKYNYHLHSNKVPTNECEVYQANLASFLSTILPPRRKWIKLGEKSRRKPQKTNEFLTSNDKNFYSLLKTIKVHKKQNSQEQWFINLQTFINEIKDPLTLHSYSVESPIIFPKLKDSLKKTGKNECRPICMFNLKDRIILSITNKFLTRLFDNFFQDNSYAFRSKKNKDNKTLSHHDCIKDILKYREKYNEEKLYVVECDMKKFYDTVNHKIAESLFDELIIKAQAAHFTINLETPIRIFKNYLNCFAFNVDIPKPSDLQYWSSHRIPNGEFTWIEDISEHYDSQSLERIGVPQGGALSGLIANIYLNQADIKLRNCNVLYQRFCDDMIIISNNLQECKNAKEIYEASLYELKLFPHKFKDEYELTGNSPTKRFTSYCKNIFSFIKRQGRITSNILSWVSTIFRNKQTDSNDIHINYKSFWQGKSKGPYCWGKIEDNCFPWIGFVGYEIDYLGNIRVRKKSLEKEISKQKIIINEIKDAIKVGIRKSKKSVIESAINRLIGMSVGRIGLDNFDEVSTDLCWKNGFKELTLNKHSIKQIKHLDRNRSKQYYKLQKELKPTKYSDIKSPSTKRKQVVRYDKPFSYYYQILERKKTN